MQEDIEGHRPVYKSLVSSSDNLIGTCDSVGVTDGVPEVQAEVQHVVDRWSMINEFYCERREQVSEAENKVKKYRNLLLPLENSVKKAEKSLEEPLYEGIDLEEGRKELQKAKVRMYFCLS